MYRKEREIRTASENLMVGEAVTYNNQPAAKVKHGKKTDIITLNEFASQIYGIEVRCEVIPIIR